VVCAIVLLNDWARLPEWCLVPGGRPGGLGERTAMLRTGFGAVLSYTVLGLAAGALAYQFSVEARLDGASFVIDRKLDEHLVPSLAVAELALAAGGVVWLAWQRQWLAPKLVRRAVGAACLIMTSVAAGMLGARWHAGFAAYYDAFFYTGVFGYLEQRVTAGTRVCVLSARSYPFAGSRRQFVLVQAHATANQPDRFRTPQTLLEYMRDMDVQLLAVRRGPSLWSRLRLDRWSKDHPGVLKLLWEDNTFALIKVDRARLSEAFEVHAVRRKRGPS